MKKSFFDTFERQEKKVSRAISLHQNDWDLIDAYRLYGATKTGHEIPAPELIKKIIVSHIKKDPNFSNDLWLQKAKDIQKAAVE